MSLGVLAVLGLVGGLRMESMPVWRVGAFLALAIVAYLHGRHVDSRFGWQVIAGVAAVGCGVVAATAPAELSSVLFTLVITVVLPWLAGRYRRQQVLLFEAERERVRQLEREQEHVAERARLQERGRLAADLHDSLGHELALIALRAGALELSPELADRHQKAAGEMRSSAVAATDRLRQALEMLRERDDVPPVEEVVARARDAGMAVTLEGPPAMPGLVDQAVRRVVREALTNAAKHAPGAPVTVAVAAERHRVTVHVANSARQPATTGSGLVGLQERLRLLGGRLDTAYRDGTFHLDAEVPVA
ncbi:sensor histidine kinase [Actinophytocola sp.]|uniref:sensor histidine kinase n=1 Tax=Actinophytocola sp. TaxID=1872138 RepID=UPI002ED47A50